MKTNSYSLYSIICISILTLSLATLVISCGGGGGGGSGESDIADSVLTADVYTLEVGGAQNIRLAISNVQDNLAIKFRYPEALQYVAGSAIFKNGDDNVQTNPAYDLSETPSSSSSSSSSDSSGSTSSSSASATAVPTATATTAATSSGTSGSKAEVVYEKHYLVFYITKDAFGSEPSGTLTFKLRAKDVQEGGRIELDVDLDDPSINNDDEFSVSDPLFEKEQAVDVRVRN